VILAGAVIGSVNHPLILAIRTGSRRLATSPGGPCVRKCVQSERGTMFGLSTAARDTEFTWFAADAAASLTRTAYLLTGDREQAADLVQESLLRTYLA